MADHDPHTTDRGPGADRPKRRTSTPEYKLRIVTEYDAASTGEKGALPRREGLYGSSIQLRREQRDADQLTTAATAAPAPRKNRTPEQEELEQPRKDEARLERADARMSKKPARTEAAMEVPGKAHALLEIVSESADSENS